MLSLALIFGLCSFKESVCATFGSGLPSACIVDVGDQKTSISCVEDGVSIPNSRYSFLIFSCLIFLLFQLLINPNYLMPFDTMKIDTHK